MAEQPDKQRARKKPKVNLNPEEHEAFVKIADTLGETDKGARKQVVNIVRHCGIPFAQQMLDETLKIEADGGMMTLDGERRRSTGGVYFYLVRGRMSDEQRQAVFPRREWQSKKTVWREFDWSRRDKVLSKIYTAGKVDDMHVKLIGYPGETRRAADVVVTKMQHEGGKASIPGGLPPLPEHQTIYNVYISAQQWGKVEKSLATSDKMLVVEGMAFMDQEHAGISVFATNVKTQKKRVPKDTAEDGAGDQADETPATNGNGASSAIKAGVEAQSNGGKSASATVGANGKAKTNGTKKPIEKTVPILDVPAGMSTPDEKRFRDLNTAAVQYRKKIANLEAQPEDKRTGLEMTRKLLDNTEKLIENMREKYASA
ncbi:MAG: phosphorylated adapter RNA export RNA-binding domain-containing protein [Aggregatilineales bacterium]